MYASRRTLEEHVHMSTPMWMLLPHNLPHANLSRYQERLYHKIAAESSFQMVYNASRYMQWVPYYFAFFCYTSCFCVSPIRCWSFLVLFLNALWYACSHSDRFSGRFHKRLDMQKSSNCYQVARTYKHAQVPSPASFATVHTHMFLLDLCLFLSQSVE